MLRGERPRPRHVRRQGRGALPERRAYRDRVLRCRGHRLGTLPGVRATVSVRATRSGDDATPLIGISAYGEVAAWGVWRQDAAVLPYAYVEQVARAGGAPVLLPPLDRLPPARAAAT